MQLPAPDEASFLWNLPSSSHLTFHNLRYLLTYLLPTLGSTSALHPKRKCKHAVPPKNPPTTHMKKKKEEKKERRKKKKKKNRLLRPERLPSPNGRSQSFPKRGPALAPPCVIYPVAQLHACAADADAAHAQQHAPPLSSNSVNHLGCVYQRACTCQHNAGASRSPACRAAPLQHQMLVNR